MNARISVALVLLASLSAAGQQTSRNALPPLQTVLSRDVTQSWMLAVTSNDLSVKAKGSSHLIPAAKQYFDTSSTERQHVLLRARRDAVMHLAGADGVLGSSDFEGFTYDPADVPFRVAAHAGAPVFIVVGLVIETTFNSRLTTPRGRASTVASRHALPALARIAREKSLGVKFCGVQILYGVHDRDALDSVGEAVTIVVPLVSALAFAEGRLSEDRLVRAADAYVTSMHAGTFRKVELQPE
ncbi:MAG: hypothetical protein LAN70_17920 [Acidobacteriia bacterium]|nr:hypothetical protein [Terriglobia bacterium]